MFQKAAIQLLVVMMPFACVTSAVEIETVPIGNPGNPPDGMTGYGSVDYWYRIGTYEVTAGQYCEFLNAVAATDTFNLWSPLMWDSEHGCKIERSGEEGHYAYSVAPGRANRPVNYVSWRDAVRFANWMHNGQPTGAQDLTTTEDGAYFLNGITTREDLMEVVREPDAVWFVPSEDEWYKAAYHKNDGVTGNYWRYPTGTNISPSNDLTDPDPGNNANYWLGGYTLGEPYYTTEVGEFENSVSPYGTFDQAGNVWEWNEGTLYEGRFRGWRGGYWSYHLSASSLVSAWSRNGSDPWAEKADSGFRLATIPIPGDLNGDGYVGGADLDIVRANWTHNVNPGDLSQGDSSGDGIVGSADLDIVRANWGSPIAIALPEPNTIILAILGALFPGCRRRR